MRKPTSRTKKQDRESFYIGEQLSEMGMFFIDPARDLGTFVASNSTGKMTRKDLACAGFVLIKSLSLWGILEKKMEATFSVYGDVNRDNELSTLSVRHEQPL